MKKQLVTSVEVTCVPRGFDGNMEMIVLGKVFYTRRTRILKRLIRKVIHRVEVPIDFFNSIEEAKAVARQQMDEFARKYYNSI